MKTPLDRGLFKRRVQKPTINRSLRGAIATRVIGPWEWIFAPALIVIAMTVVLATPLELFGLELPEPVSPLILAFVWPLIRPSFITPVVLALLGLFLDFYWSAPMGFYTLTLMLVYGVLTTLRTYVAGQDWRVVFGIFLATEIVFFALGVVLVALDSGHVINLIAVFLQLIGTTLLFPVIPYLLDKYVHADVRFN